MHCCAAAALGLALALPGCSTVAARNVAAEAEITSTGSLSPSFPAAQAIDGSNETAWISSIQVLRVGDSESDQLH